MYFLLSNMIVLIEIFSVWVGYYYQLLSIKS